MISKKYMPAVAVVMVLLLSYLVSGSDISQRDSQGPKIDCQECHVCEVPTGRKPCLKICPRTAIVHQSASHDLSEAPDSMLLDELVDEYQAVHFNHKFHAEMAEMGGDCVTCHHYSPKGDIPPCKECHGGEGNPNNLNQPTLKGAYHRQCLSCHREWSHDTKCFVCHIPTAGMAITDHPPDSTDIIGISHPVITEPVKKVYHTPYEPGEVVTFQHKEHIDLFGFRCVDCHRKENCSYCHDIQRPTAALKTQEEVHAICNDCHIDDECSKCHDVKERPGFSHTTTGWPLNRYHNELDCRACHPTGKRISKLGRMCVNCHAGWNQENFKHAVTGLRLDEVHSEMDCSDCHTDNRYDEDPVCSDCHDDDRTAESAPPGVKIKHTGTQSSR